MGETKTQDFIIDIDDFFFNEFNGKMAKCQFSINNYSKDIFKILGIKYPTPLINASIRRQAEFLAGRVSAKKAMEMLDFPYSHIDINNNRAPIWPSGLVGSISHHKNSACCVVALTKNYRGVGVDIEICMNSDAAAEAMDLILDSEEQKFLSRQPIAFEFLVTLAFSAKESLFKALFPEVNRYFDFLEARIISLDIQNGRLVLQLKTNLTPILHSGCSFVARYRIKDSEILTLVSY